MKKIFIFSGYLNIKDATLASNIREVNDLTCFKIGILFV